MVNKDSMGNVGSITQDSLSLGSIGNSNDLGGFLKQTPTQSKVNQDDWDESQSI